MGTITLKQHNQEAFDKLMNRMNVTDRTCVVAPCGTGKSFIAFRVAQENPNARVLWMSPSNVIFKQQRKNLAREAPDADVSKVKQMTYATAWSHVKRGIVDKDRPADIIILDEFHRLGAPKWAQGANAIIDRNPGAKVIGFSATKERYSEQRDMSQELFSGDIASESTLFDALETGILKTPVYVRAFYDYDFTDLDAYQGKIGTIGDSEQQADARNLYQQLRTHLENAESVNKIFKNHLLDASSKLIIFCKDTKHLNSLVDKASEWFGLVNSDIHTYRTLSKYQQSSEDFAAFKEDDSNALKVLYCINMLNEGVHVGDVDAIVMVRPTWSPNIFYQQLGRAFDIGSQKIPLVFDLVNNILSGVRASTFGKLSAVDNGQPEQPEQVQDSFKDRFDVRDYTYEAAELLEQLKDRIHHVRTIDEVIEEVVEWYKERGKYRE